MMADLASLRTLVSGTDNIDLDLGHRKIVVDVLRAHLPPGATTWVFGSRANGGARRCSDLDLAIGAGRRVSLDEMAILAEAFSESDLPYRVDIVDWHAIDASFQRIIAGDRALLIDAVPDVTPPRR